MKVVALVYSIFQKQHSLSFMQNLGEHKLICFVNFIRPFPLQVSYEARGQVFRFH